ncbi:MAG: GntR family transcriptional regulator [Chloroflexota bacterium]|nr:GntR family transcriptional regulator [Chloroflexota bacterium]
MSVFGGPIAPSPSKADQVYEQICAAIFAGRLKPGDRVNVDEITRDLGVSKIPVREAMQRLEARGLIVQTPYAGARVAPVSLREWRGVFLVRIELEGLAARLAAEMMTEAELAELRAAHAEMERLHAAGRLDLMSAQNRRFHRLIGRAAGYRSLAELVEQVLLTVARYRAVLELDPTVWRQVLDEHAAIIDALASRDPAVAETVAQAHVRGQYDSTLGRRLGEFEATNWTDAP